MSPAQSRDPGVEKLTPLVIGILVVILLAGGGLRLWHLGSLGLVGDEGHQALAVQGILDHGVPLVPSGNVYLRGAPFLYAEAAVARWAGVDPWSLRLPAALFGTLAILATFLLARRLFDTEIALVAAALLAVSLWGLELAHYARMYTLLQLLFVLAAYAFVRGYLDGERGWRPLTWLLMALAIVTHQLGVMLLLLFLLPAFLDEAELPAALHGRRRFALLVPAAILGSGWLLYHQLVGSMMVRTATAFGGGDEAAQVAPGVLGLIAEHLRIPQMTMPLNLLGSDRLLVAAAASLFTVLALAILVVGLRHPGQRLRALVSLAFLAAAFMNLFAVAVGLLLLALFLFPGATRELRHPPWAIAIIGGGLFAVYWGVYLLTHRAALDPGWGEPWSIPMVFAAYPPFQSRVLHWFLAGWPRMTLWVLGGLVFLALLFLNDRRRRNALVAIAIVVLPLVAVTFGSEVNNEARYHFHIYPFMLIVFAAVITMLARAAIAGLDILLAYRRRRFAGRRPLEVALIVVAALAFSRDVAPGALASFERRDYATAKDPTRATLNWQPYATFHQDHASAAAYVRARLAPGDRVLCFGPTYWASIYQVYVGQLDYMICEKAARIYRGAQIVHHVTGVPCLTSVGELEQVLAGNRDHRLWVLGDQVMLSDASAYFTPEMKEQLRWLSQPCDYLARDADTLVRRIDPDRQPESDGLRDAAR